MVENKLTRRHGKIEYSNSNYVGYYDILSLLCLALAFNILYSTSYILLEVEVAVLVHITIYNLFVVLPTYLPDLD